TRSPRVQVVARADVVPGRRRGVRDILARGSQQVSRQPAAVWRRRNPPTGRLAGPLAAVRRPLLLLPFRRPAHPPRTRERLRVQPRRRQRQPGRGQRPARDRPAESAGTHQHTARKVGVGETFYVRQFAFAYVENDMQGESYYSAFM